MTWVLCYLIMHSEEEYDCPGPSGGVMDRYPLACPNHSKADIKVKDIADDSHKMNYRKNY